MDGQLTSLEIRQSLNGRWQFGAPQHGAYSRHQREMAERLHDVVVSAQFQTTHLLRFIAATSEHDDRHFRNASDRVYHLEPVHLRQTHVYEHQIRVLTE